MNAGIRSLLSLITILLACYECISQSAVGCSSYGCNPSGTFSFVIKVPQSKASIAWTTEDLFLGPVPFATGCVGNKDNVLCPSNGPRDVSYISLYIETGGLVWRDFLLRFPQLPVTDSNGNVYGSDGHFLVIFDMDGHFKKQIRLDEAMFPIFSAKMTANNIIFLASRNGHIQTFRTEHSPGQNFPIAMYVLDMQVSGNESSSSGNNGSPHASMSLTGSIKSMNGNFLPVTTPSVAGNRVYVLTKFNASNSKKEKPEIYRLFLFDVVDESNHLKIAYYLDFENSIVSFNGLQEVKTKSENIVRYQNNEDINDDFEETTNPFDDLEPRVMSNNGTNNVYISIPQTNTTGTLYALEDNDQSSNISLLFKVHKSLRKISMFMINSDLNDKKVVNVRQQVYGSNIKNRENQGILWGLESNREVIIGINSSTGHIISTTNISVILQERVVITSEIMVVRKDENFTIDHFIFGIRRNTSNISAEFSRLCYDLNVASNATRYLVYLTEKGVSWMVQSPRDLDIVGQIAGIPNRLFTSNERNVWQLKDILVSFAGNQSVSVVFGVW